MSRLPEVSGGSVPFKDRHKALSNIPEGKFPRRVGLRLDPQVTTDFQPLLRSVIATAFEYKDSPVEDLQILIASGNPLFSSYATSFFEGYLSSSRAQLVRNNVSISWEGPHAQLSKTSVERIEQAEKSSPATPDLRLHLVFENVTQSQPDLVIDPVISERVIGDQNRVVVYPEFTPAAVDAAIAAFANPASPTA